MSGSESDNTRRRRRRSRINAKYAGGTYLQAPVVQLGIAHADEALVGSVRGPVDGQQVQISMPDPCDL